MKKEGPWLKRISCSTANNILITIIFRVRKMDYRTSAGMIYAAPTARSRLREELLEIVVDVAEYLPDAV